MTDCTMQIRGVGVGGGVICRDNTPPRYGHIYIIEIHTLKTS